MKKVTIVIETKNAAFGDSPEEAMPEVVRILEAIIADWQYSETLYSQLLRDVNGNAVGNAVVR